jgi:hypothetical protein
MIDAGVNNALEVMVMVTVMVMPSATIKHANLRN